MGRLRCRGASVSCLVIMVALLAHAMPALAQGAGQTPAIALPPVPDAPVSITPDDRSAPLAATAGPHLISATQIKDALAAIMAHAQPPGAARGQSALARQRNAVIAFYAARGGEPLWLEQGEWTGAARAALEQLGHASEDALDLHLTQPPTLDTADPARMANAEFNLSLAVANYAWQAGGGRIDPKSINRLITEIPAIVEPDVALRAVAGSTDAAAALRDFNPPQPGYAALREKLAELRRDDGADKLAMAREQAIRDARAPMLRDRPATPSQAMLVGEVIANMERWRWEPRAQTHDEIEVNIPDYQVKVIMNGVVVHSARVIVGKPDTPTPVFSNRMQFIEVNPYWNVPESIIQNEMMPRLAKDPNYLKRLGYEVHYDRRGKISVRQPPGERNALGRIKFMFPNEHAVYLHDTPSRGLFASARRAFSHGCVRVENPFKFAEVVLGKDSGWSEARVKKLIGGKNQTIPLPNFIDIHIEYFTAFVDENGVLQTRPDVYGYSKKVRAALGLAT